MTKEPASRSEAGADLARGVAWILAAGLVLGIGFNALQQTAGSERGLAWVREEVALASLDDPQPPAADPAPEPARAQPLSAGDTNPAPPPDGAAPSPDRSRAPAAPARSPAAASRETAPQKIATGGARAADTAKAGTRPGLPDLPDVPEADAPREVTFEIAKRFHDAGAAVFVDARTREEYEEGHIPGALLLPFDDVFEQPALAERFDPGARPIIAYCGSADCNLSRDLAFALVEGGHRRVLLFRGGVEEWRAKGQTIATGGAPAEPAP